MALAGGILIVAVPGREPSGSIVIGGYNFGIIQTGEGAPASAATGLAQQVSVTRGGNRFERYRKRLRPSTSWTRDWSTPTDQKRPMTFKIAASINPILEFRVPSMS